jgi:hypothetical protein
MLKLDCKRLAVVFGLIIFLMYYIGRQVFHPYSYAAFIAFGFCLADAVVIMCPWCIYIYIYNYSQLGAGLMIRTHLEKECLGNVGEVFVKKIQIQ